MADTIDILAAGAQENVATVYHGVTPVLDGWWYGRVPLVKQRKSAAVDVSGYTQLTVTVAISAMTNKHGAENSSPTSARLHVAIEHVHPVRGWELLHKFEPMVDPVSQAAILTGFGGSIRVSYYWARPGNPAATIEDQVVLSFGFSAAALPEAA